MFTNLLVPIDFSEPCTAALRLAVKLARENKATITLLHVGLAPGVGSYDLGGYGVPIPATLVQLHEEAAREQEHALHKLGREEIPDDLSYRVITCEGSASDEVIAEAGKGYDLMIMGTHGRGGLSRAFLGSVTERVLRSSPIPVLVTR
jgi:nucleotide-binding universal stress UspA family protein